MIKWFLDLFSCRKSIDLTDHYWEFIRSGHVSFGMGSESCQWYVCSKCGAELEGLPRNSSSRNPLRLEFVELELKS